MTLTGKRNVYIFYETVNNSVEFDHGHILLFSICDSQSNCVTFINHLTFYCAMIVKLPKKEDLTD